MRRLLDGILIGFGFALSILLFASWHLLLRCLDSRYLIVGEAKVMEATHIATGVGTLLGVLLVAVGLVVELLGRRKK